MKKILLLFLYVFPVLFASAQRYEWVSHSNQPWTNYAIPVAVDPAGNVYTLINGPTSIVIGTDTFPSLAGGWGVLITKFSAAGNFIWGKMVSNTGGQVGVGKVAADNAGSVYASLFFGNGGTVTMTDTVFTPAGGQGVIIKLLSLKLILNLIYHEKKSIS